MWPRRLIMRSHTRIRTSLPPTSSKVNRTRKPCEIPNFLPVTTTLFGQTAGTPNNRIYSRSPLSSLLTTIRATERKNRGCSCLTGNQKMASLRKRSAGIYTMSTNMSSTQVSSLICTVITIFTNLRNSSQLKHFIISLCFDLGGTNSVWTPLAQHVATQERKVNLHLHQFEQMHAHEVPE